MSGPKISKAELEARKQRQLAEEKRRKADIIFEIKSNENRFIHSNIEINDYEIHEKLNKKFLEIKERYYKKLEKLSKKATSKRKVQDLEDIRKNFENIFNEFKEKYDEIFLTLENNINKIEQNEIYKVKDEIINLIDQFPVEGNNQMELISKKMEKLLKKFLGTADRDISKIEDIKFQNIKLEKRERKKGLSSIKRENIKHNTLSISEKQEAQIKEIQTDDILEEISNFIKSDKYTRKNKNEFLYMKQEILALKENNEIDLDIKEALVLEKINIIQEELKNIKFDNRRIELLYSDYLKEIFYSGKENKKLIKDFSSKEELEKEIESLKIKNQEITKRDYIQEQLDEVMRKHGYNVIDSADILKDRKENEILYGVNDSTGINVFMSDDSSLVTMKVIGIGFDEEITERESDRLYAEQCNFCSMHPELVDELRTRGIIFEEKKYNKPDKRYNSKIKVKNTVNNRKSNRKKSKEITQNVKKMYRGE
jgi:hypothetical protein